MAVRIINENSVSSDLPKTIDSFLQDFAQVYGGISYSDIVKLGDVWYSISKDEIKLTIREIKQELKGYAGDLYELSEEDATVKKLCDKLIELVKDASTIVPKSWNKNTAYRYNVLDAYNSGELTFDNIKEWEKKYYFGCRPQEYPGTKDILRYYIHHQEELLDTSKNMIIEDGVLLRVVKHDLKSIAIPNNVTKIGSGAFADCRNLTSITIPNRVTKIGGYAFSDCTNLRSISIPDGITSIGDYAFQNCTNLRSISIPDSVTSIGEDAFNNCKSLTIYTDNPIAIKHAEECFTPYVSSEDN